jgi:quercetin dioxygenase-like cupin family protein
MASIRVVDESALPWLAEGEGEYVAGRRPEMVEVGPDAPGVSYRPHHPGSEVELQLSEIRNGPNHVTAPHAHLVDEIIYVTQGEMILGARTLRPGSSVYIPAKTLYGFRAGPEGLTFLNFRPQEDTAYLSKEQFLARREARKGAPA